MIIKLPGMSIGAETALEVLRFKMGLNPADGTPLPPNEIQFVPWEAFDGLPDLNPNRIVFADLYATAGMSSRVGGRAAWGLAVRLRSDATLGGNLQAIPMDATPRTRGVGGAVVSLIDDLLDIPYVGTAVACKILCRKRPGLFPMWDSLVDAFVAAQSPNELSRLYGAERVWQGTQWLWSQIDPASEDPTVRMNVEAVESIASMLTREVQALSPDGPPVTSLRVLESLIWVRQSSRWWRLWPGALNEDTFAAAPPSSEVL